MPCLFAIIGFFFPRIVMVLLYLFTDYMGRAFQTALWPILGFFFAPFTTLAYAWAVNSQGGVHGLGLAAVILGVLLDLGVIGGGDKERRKRFRKKA
ncbi:MAG TPA: hypothetical protein VD997_10665 [Phycisphaerales bacterium]|nr:hypothetical protein [Phycisphaerales bacterium]